MFKIKLAAAPVSFEMSSRRVRLVLIVSVLVSVLDAGCIISEVFKDQGLTGCTPLLALSPKS